MNKLVLIIFILLLIIGAYVLVIYWVNRSPRQENLQVDKSGPSIPRLQPTKILTWNIGYCGLGKDADFKLDGGKQFRPKHKSLVSNNLKAVSQQLINSDADFLLLQEACTPSIFSHGINIWQQLIENLPDHPAHWFAADFETQLVPNAIGFALGNASFSKYQIESAELENLPKETVGIFPNNYRMHISRIPVENSSAKLVLINIHLSAFDKEAKLRLAQLNQLKKLITKEYNVGNYVIIGGDWNLKLTETVFPHTTEEEHLFWVHSMPADWAPAKWLWAVDPTTPTCRTAQKPFVEGENYTLIIDGFLVSPNIKINHTKTLDLKFLNTDHHPVILDFSLE